MKTVALVFERLTFIKIIMLWIAVVLIFSLAHFSLGSSGIPTFKESLNTNVLGNAVYFSCITALTIGYGDIAPVGIGKSLAIIEAIASIILFGALIAKIVSVKQEHIIEEIQELSYEESGHNAISELYLFRSQAKELKEKIDGKTKTKDFREIENSIETLKDALTAFNKATLTSHEDKEKTILKIGLITNSINFSLSRFVELLESVNKHKIAWKKESIAPAIAEIQKTTETLYAQYNALKSDDESSKKVGEKLEDLNKTLATLQESLQRP
jgi:potassium channel LctB